MKVRIVVSFILCCILSSKMMSDIYWIYTENSKTISECIRYKHRKFYDQNNDKKLLWMVRIFKYLNFILLAVVFPCSASLYLSYRDIHD